MKQIEIMRNITQKIKKYSDEEILSSPQFYDMLQNGVYAILYNIDRTIKLVCHSIENDMTAYTDNKTIHLNTWGELIRDLPSLKEKYLNCYGLVTHECGHILYHNFQELPERIKKWQDSKYLYGYPNTKKAKDIMNELDKYPNYKKLYIRYMSTLDNVICDIHDENCIYQEFDGLCTEGLTSLNKEMYRQQPSIKEQIDMLKEGKITLINMALMTILLEGKGFKIKDENLDEDEQFIFSIVRNVLDEAKEELDRLQYESDSKEISKLMNVLFVKLFPLFLFELNQEQGTSNDESQDSQNSSSDNGSSNTSESKSGGSGNSRSKQNNSSQNSEGSNQGSGDGSKEESEGNESDTKSLEDLTEEELKELLKELEREENSFSPKHNGKGKGRQIKIDEQKTKEGKEAAEQNEQSATKEQLMNQIISKIIKDLSEVEIEKMHSEELDEEIQAMQLACKPNGDKEFGEGMNLIRVQYNEVLKREYNILYSKVKQESKALSRKIKTIWKERTIDECESGFIFGNKFNPRDVIRNDGKYFSRITNPGEKIETCFGVLIDESGSMYGEKIQEARNAAILLESALKDLGVPVMVCGHTTGDYDNKVIIRSYCDYDTLDGKDCYRLADIKARDGNIDGYAITYMAEKLLKRPEKRKVLIVISDGWPCGGSYYAANGFDDVPLCLEKYRKIGLNIFGACVDNYEDIERLYGEKYTFDCRNGQLTSSLIRLIKRYCIR